MLSLLEAPGRSCRATTTQLLNYSWPVLNIWDKLLCSFALILKEVSVTCSLRDAAAASFTCSSRRVDLSASLFVSVRLCHFITPIFRITFSCITWLLLTLTHTCLLDGRESTRRLRIQASGGFSTNQIQLKVLAQGSAWQQHDRPFSHMWSDLIWYHQITSHLFSPRLVSTILRICPNKDAAVERQMAHLITIWSQATFWG